MLKSMLSPPPYPTNPHSPLQITWLQGGVGENGWL